MVLAVTPAAGGQLRPGIRAQVRPDQRKAEENQQQTGKRAPHPEKY
jgi:hypothetical protein